MKKLTQIFILSVFLIGCAPTYIQVLNTTSTNTQLKNDFYVYETDTLLIKYFFWGEKGIFAFSIFNKLNRPVFIDWKNSSFIYNDDKLDYWSENETYYTTGIYKVLSYHGKPIRPGYSLSEGSNESITHKYKPARVTFIPPRSNYYQSSFSLLEHHHYWNDLKDTIIPRNIGPKEKNMYVSSRSDLLNEKTKMYVVHYSYDNSPIRFRNYLTFSFDENFSQVFRVDNEFFVSTIMNMDNLHFQGKNLGDSYHLTFEYPFKNNTSFYISTLK